MYVSDAGGDGWCEAGGAVFGVLAAGVFVVSWSELNVSDVLHVVLGPN